MARALIAVRSEDLAAALAETITEYEVYVCHTGEAALAALETYRPDGLILDLSLPWGSGLAVLQQTRYRPPVILALTNIIGESILQAAADAGVQHMVLLPCPARTIARHLDALMQKCPASES